MDCRVFVEFGVECGDELIVLPRRNDLAVDNGERLRAARHRLDVGRADEGHRQRAESLEAVVREEAAELAAVGIALDRDVHGREARNTAVDLLCEQDESGAGAKDRHSFRDARAERIEQVEVVQQAAHDRALAAGDDEAVERLFEVACLPDLKMRLAQTVEHGGVLRERALKR